MSTSAQAPPSVLLDDQVCFALYSASRAVTAAYRGVLAEHGLTYPQYVVLLALWEQDGLAVRELGQRLRLDSGTLSPLLRRLEESGQVHRRRTSTDGRLLTVHLTPDGEALRRLADDAQRHLGGCLDLDPDEAAQLRTLARRIFATQTPSDPERPRVDPGLTHTTTQGVSMNVAYTAEALATGSGRNGHVRTTDGMVDTDLAIPREMGGQGGAPNPELLFAAGYAACFHSALQAVARADKAELGDSSVGAKVGIGSNDAGGFELAVELEVVIPDLPHDEAQTLADKAHQVCPYSNATRGNIEVTVTVVND